MNIDAPRIASEKEHQRRAESTADALRKRTPFCRTLPQSHRCKEQAVSERIAAGPSTNASG